MKNLSNLITWSLLFGGLLAGPSSAFAQSQYYWDATSPIDMSPGAGGSGYWNTTAGNSVWYVSGSSDSIWVNGNIANFAGAAGTATVNTAVTANGITFATSGYTVAGSSTLTLAGTPTITVPSGGSETMSCPIAGTVPVTVSGSGTLNLSHVITGLTGGLTINLGTTVGLTSLPGAGTGTITDNGTLSTVTSSGIFSTPTTGAGVINLNIVYSTASDNYRFTGSSLANFSGTVNLIAGLNAGQPGTGQVIMTNTVSSSMTWNIGSGATLDFATQSGVTYPANVVINGPGNSQPYGALRLDSVNLTGNVLLNGSGAMIGDDAAGGAAPSQISGNITDGGNNYGFTKIAPRSIILAGVNTYTGPTVISAGTLQLGSAETVGTSGPLGKSPASNPNNIVLSGGTLQYSTANNNDYSGRFSTASSQAYNIDENGENVIFATPLTSSAGSLTLGDALGGGSLTLSGANTYSGTTTVTLGNLIITGSIAGTVITLTTAVSSLQLGNANALPAGADLTLPSSPTSGSVNLNFSGTQNVTTLNFGSTIMPSGTYGAPGNNNVLYQNSAFTGPGILNVQPPTYWDGNGSDALNDTSSDGGGPGNWDTNTADWWRSGSSDIKWGANNVATFAGTAGIVTLDGSVVADGLTFITGGYDINNVDGVSTLTLAGTPIITIPGGSAEIDCVLAGTAGLTLSGSGTLTLGGTNTYTGPTSIGNGCALVLNQTNAYAGATSIGSGGALTIGASGELAAGAYPGNIADSGGSFTYSSSAPQTLSGIISGSGTVTQNGPGTLTLSGLNTYTGATTISSGTLIISGSGDLGNNITFNTGLYAGSIVDTGEFIYNSSAAQTLSGIISGSGGTLTQEGSATLTLSGANTYTGGTTNSAGTLDINATGSVMGDVTVSGGSLEMDSASAMVSTATLNAAAGGTHVKLTYTGTQTINALFIGGIQQVPGVYGASAYNPDSIFSGTGTLTVSTGGGSSPVTISLAVVNNNQLVITWSSASGADYNVYTTPSLAPPVTWTLVNSSPIPATGASTSYTLPGTVSGNLFVTVQQ